jgi:hypothetical protein
VHEKIFPRISTWQREYLAQFFTVIFQDGFESGNFSAWTGTSITSGDSLTVANDNPHHGTYSAKMVTGVTTDVFTYAHKTLATTYTTLYQRVYVKISSVSTTVFNADGKRVDFVIFVGSGGRVVQAGLMRNSGAVKWHLQYRNAGSWYDAFSATPTPQANTWYCFEVMQTTGSSGSDRLYINGNLVIEVTGVSNNDRGSPAQIQAFGEHYVASSVTVWIDCVVAADILIGQEGQTYEIYIDAVSQSLATSAHETTYNIAKDASLNSQSLTASEATFNINKDASLTSQTSTDFETTFNVLKDAITQPLASVVIEVVTGIIEIFLEAIAAAEATFTLESTFNINKDALAHVLAEINVEAIFNLVKDAVTQASTSPKILGIYSINKNAVVNASAVAELQQILGISKNALVVSVSTPHIQSIFNISPEATVKVFAEAVAVKEGEVKVTRLFLLLGNLVLELKTGEIGIVI